MPYMGFDLEGSDCDLPGDDFLERYEIVQTSKWISNSTVFEKVCLQFPDKLLKVKDKIFEELKARVKVELHILGETPYSSCCVHSDAILEAQGDAVVHYGNACFTRPDIPVYMVLPKEKLDVKASLKLLESLTAVGHTNICVYYDAQYDHCKDEIAKYWFEHNPNGYLASFEKEYSVNGPYGRLIRNAYGKPFTPKHIENSICVLIGTRGHTLFNCKLRITARQWYALDPEKLTLKRADDTEWFKTQFFIYSKCKEATLMGILVCKPPTEDIKSVITRMRRNCVVNKIKCHVVTVGKPSPQNLSHFPEVDIFILISCPENDLYSKRSYYQPLVYPFEIDVSLDLIRTHNLQVDWI